MDLLLQIGVATAVLCLAAIGLRRSGRRPDASIAAGEVSENWLAEHRARRRD